ncbi:MAG: flavin-containing monooxygenase [Actinomycetota bacterium]
MDGTGAERFDTVIIGGGQAGLATGYHLKRLGLPFVILDAQERVGDAWRTRWDSLRLFTPARYDRLPGLPFPAPAWSFPTKDEMGDYLETYAERFELPVRTDVSVDRLSREEDRYVIAAGDRRIEADRVVVSTGANRVPKMPAFSPQLDPGILQMHSSDYRGPAQLRDGEVLLVGVGNSGAEIAFELSRTHRTWLAGKESGQIPVRHGTFRARLGFQVFRFIGHHVLTLGTPIGRRALPKLDTKAAPLIRVRKKELARAGVQRVPRVAGVQRGLPLLEGGQVLDVENVIWCTGFRQDFPWIDLPIFEEDGRPVHDRGVVSSEPGLYFVGLVGQYSFSSDVIPGAGRDSWYVAEMIASRGPRSGSAADIGSTAAA